MVDAKKCSHYGELLRTHGAEEFWSLIQKRYHGEVSVTHQALALELVNLFHFGPAKKEYAINVQHLESLVVNLTVALSDKPITPTQLVLLSCLFHLVKDDRKEVNQAF